MKDTVPISALALGLAGLLPFLWGALTLALPDVALWTIRNVSPRFVGPYVQIAYGTVILSFMSGVLWGFATKATGREATVGYSLSVLPALWAFFFIGGGPVSATVYLIFGFLGLLLLDFQFWRQGLAPGWWMQLRVLLTVVVVVCLAISVI